MIFRLHIITHPVLCGCVSKRIAVVQIKHNMRRWRNCAACCGQLLSLWDSVVLVNYFRQLAFPPVGIHAIIWVLTLTISSPPENCFPGVSLFSVRHHCLWHFFICSPPLRLSWARKTFRRRDLFAYASWITVVSKSEGSLVAPVACLSSVYLWRNQCWMLMGEICGLWLFPSHTQTLTQTRACVHARWVSAALIWRGSSCGDYRDLNLLFQCFCSCAPTLKKMQSKFHSQVLTLPVSLDTWCTFGMKGETCPSLRMVTRPTPDWLSSSWITKGSGKRYHDEETDLWNHQGG